MFVLAAIDIEPDFPALAGYVADNGLADRLLIHGGVDQGDPAALTHAVERLGPMASDEAARCLRVADELAVRMAAGDLP